MSATLDCTARCCPKEPLAHSRRGVAEKIAQFDTLDSPWTSCRRIAGQSGGAGEDVAPLGPPKAKVDRQQFLAEAVWRGFWKPPRGSIFSIGCSPPPIWCSSRRAIAGLRNLCWFLRLSGLDEFIAPSYGAQQAVAEEMESLLVRFGEEEDRRLAASMPPREITLCEDETFHPQICLVAIEPVSNFILVEQYQPQRDAKTWQQCTSAKLAALPVTVCQVTSDAAKALIAQAETLPGRASLAGPLSRAVRHGESDQRSPGEPDACRLSGIGEAAGENRGIPGRMPGRPGCRPARHPAGCVRRNAPKRRKRQPASGFDVCQARQERAQAARQGLGRDYHPVDLVTGQPLSAEEVGRRLQGHFDTLDQVAAEAGLSAHACEKLAKARRVLGAMQATVAFFWTMIAARLAAWGYDAAVAAVAAARVDSGLLSAPRRREGRHGPRAATVAGPGGGGAGAGPFPGRPLGDIQP